MEPKKKKNDGKLRRAVGRDSTLMRNQCRPNCHYRKIMNKRTHMLITRFEACLPSLSLFCFVLSFFALAHYTPLDFHLSQDQKKIGHPCPDC